MKLLLLSLLFCVNAFAQYGGMNEKAFQNEVFIASEYDSIVGNTDGKLKLQPIASDGNDNCKTARFTWDFDADGGAVGVASLGVTLPANAIVRDVIFRTETAPVTAGAGTISFDCEDAGNLHAATDLAADGDFDAGDFALGVPQGGTANMIDTIAAECEITATIASAAYTAGKIVGLADYCAF